MDTLHEMLATLKFVYKNMVWGRSRTALCALVALALFLTSNLYFGVRSIGGNVVAIPLAVIALGLWFFALPCALTLIDMKTSPRRMEKLWAAMAKQ